MKSNIFRKSPLFRLIAYTVLTAFAGMLPVSPSYAQVVIIMPPPGQMIHITRHFEPPQMVGLKVNLKDPFSFDFIMDQGEKPMSADIRKQEFNKIIKYFLVSLAMPNTDMWVNLSPYESKRIIPEVFAQTEMGRDLLAQDYILKQFTASLMYPEDGLGKKFWDNVYVQAQARFGTAEIKVNTFNKVWIVADYADVYQKGDTAFLVGSHLKVMLEQDYMAIEKNKEMFGGVQVNTDRSKDAKTQMASQLVREIIIPAIEKEVNEGKSFAAVRQVYNAEIMATWFKRALKQSLLGQVFANKSKIAGQRVKDPQAEDKIYQQYLKAYKKGVFNYIKEEVIPGMPSKEQGILPDGQMIPRKYFSGGMQEFNPAMLNVLRDPSSTAVHDFAQTAAAKFRGGRLFVTAAALLITVGGLTFSTAANAQTKVMKNHQTQYHLVPPDTLVNQTLHQIARYDSIINSNGFAVRNPALYKKYLKEEKALKDYIEKGKKNLNKMSVSTASEVTMGQSSGYDFDGLINHYKKYKNSLEALKNGSQPDIIAQVETSGFRLFDVTPAPQTISTVPVSPMPALNFGEPSGARGGPTGIAGKGPGPTTGPGIGKGPGPTRGPGTGTQPGTGNPVDAGIGQQRHGPGLPCICEVIPRAESARIGRDRKFWDSHEPFIEDSKAFDRYIEANHLEDQVPYYQTFKAKQQKLIEVYNTSKLHFDQLNEDNVGEYSRSRQEQQDRMDRDRYALEYTQAVANFAPQYYSYLQGTVNSDAVKERYRQQYEEDLDNMKHALTLIHTQEAADFRYKLNETPPIQAVAPTGMDSLAQAKVDTVADSFVYQPPPYVPKQTDTTEKKFAAFNASQDSLRGVTAVVATPPPPPEDTLTGDTTKSAIIKSMYAFIDSTAAFDTSIQTIHPQGLQDYTIFQELQTKFKKTYDDLTQEDAETGIFWDNVQWARWGQEDIREIEKKLEAFKVSQDSLGQVAVVIAPPLPPKDTLTGDSTASVIIKSMAAFIDSTALFDTSIQTIHPKGLQDYTTFKGLQNKLVQTFGVIITEDPETRIFWDTVRQAQGLQEDIRGIEKKLEAFKTNQDSLRGVTAVVTAPPPPIDSPAQATSPVADTVYQPLANVKNQINITDTTAAVDTSKTVPTITGAQNIPTIPNFNLHGETVMQWIPNERGGWSRKYFTSIKPFIEASYAFKNDIESLNLQGLPHYKEFKEAQDKLLSIYAVSEQDFKALTVDNYDNWKKYQRHKDKMEELEDAYIQAARALWPELKKVVPTAITVLNRNRQRFDSAQISSLLEQIQEARRHALAAVARARHSDSFGGINLSDENLVINIKVDGAGMPLPAQFQNKAMLNLNGLTSIILKITPLTPENVPALFELLK